MKSKYLEALQSIGHLPKLKEGSEYIDYFDGEVKIKNKHGSSIELYDSCLEAFNKKFAKHEIKEYQYYLELTTETRVVKTIEHKMIWESE